LLYSVEAPPQEVVLAGGTVEEGAEVVDGRALELLGGSRPGRPSRGLIRTMSIGRSWRISLSSTIGKIRVSQTGKPRNRTRSSCWSSGHPLVTATNCSHSRPGKGSSAASR
jgi:hypothetical protein